ncbi:MAG TPA: EutN/CcmL family microcompartment protein [Acidobacteriaceae bacterium]|jgi:ethanolamine utilization protein EutN
MRLGIVRGHVTLSPAVPELIGKTLVVLEPVTMTNLVAKNGLGGGKSLVAVDALGAAQGQMVAFTEGAEATNPYWPNRVPIDAYCTLIVDSITTGNPKNQEAEVSK